jgi:hypothetical protein
VAMPDRRDEARAPRAQTLRRPPDLVEPWRGRSSGRGGGHGRRPLTDYGASTQAEYRRADRHAMLRLLVEEEKRTEPLYHAAHEALTATYGLSGLMIGLLWDGKSALFAHPDRETPEGEARARCEAHPMAKETVTRGYTAFLIWSIWRKIRLLDPALHTYVSVDIDEGNPLDRVRALLKGPRRRRKVSPRWASN